MNRLGLMAFATDTGLGIQTRALYKHLKPAKTMLVDLSQFNHMPVHEDWYDATVRTDGIPTHPEIDSFLKDLDVVMVCETPLNYYLFERAEQLGIKTYLQANPEFFDYFNRPWLPRPSAVVPPSLWMMQQMQDAVSGTPVDHLPVPIDSAELPQRTITRARHFFHVAGRPAIHDRNGTLDFITAVKLAAGRMPDAQFTLFMQQPSDDIKEALAGAPAIKRVWNVHDPSDMYQEGDVLVLPRRYGGLCLPAQEAAGCGIPVLMPDISPNNQWLPSEWLIRAVARVDQFQARRTIDMHNVNLVDLADRMVALYYSDGAVLAMSKQAQQIAGQMSWETLLPRYQEVLGLKELVA